MEYTQETRQLVSKWPYKSGERMTIGNKAFEILRVEKQGNGKYLVYYRELDSRPNACRNGR
jgi:hypothetical protein